MKIKVNHNELKATYKNITKNTNELATQVDILGKTVEEINSLWKGVDGSAFYNTTISYVGELRKIPQIYDALTKEIITLNEQYFDIDDKNAVYYYPTILETDPTVLRNGELEAVDSFEIEGEFVYEDTMKGEFVYEDTMKEASGNYVVADNFYEDVYETVNGSNKGGA